MCFRRKKGQQSWQKKNIIVRGGLNIRSQELGSGKGEFFTGNLAENGTIYVDRHAPVWNLVFDHLETGKRYTVDFTGQMWIGRNVAPERGSCKLEFPGDDRMSREHCMIYMAGGNLCIQDLQSSNHTYLNGSRLDQPAYLRNGDVIRAGRSQLRVMF